MEPVIALRNVSHWFGEGALRQQILHDATTAIPVSSPTDPISAEETRAIPVSRPAGDSEVATEKLNARGQNGGVSAQDLLRREGRI